MRASIWLLLTVFSLTACGSPPLIRPETSPSQMTVAPTSESIPTQIRPALPTLPLTSTPILSPTIVPFILPSGEEPIDGYVFETPEEIQGIDNNINLSITGWVPGSDEEMMVVGDNFVDAVNIQTGKNRRLFEWNVENRFSVSNPVWLPSSQTIALILGNFETKQYELWINTPKQKSMGQLRLTNIERSFIPVNIDSGLGVYDLEARSLKTISNDGKIINSEATPLRTASEASDFPVYNINRFNNWVVYYNQDDIFIINLETKDKKEISFDNEFTSIWGVQWSWDGEKLALLLSEGDFPLSFLSLYVYDLANDKLQKIHTPFTRFIKAITWAPDNRHIVVNAVIGGAEYQTSYGDSFISSKQSLFLVNTLTMKSSLIPIFSPDIASSVGEVLYSPDERYLIARYRFYEGEISTYRIEVTKR